MPSHRATRLLRSSPFALARIAAQSALLVTVACLSGSSNLPPLASDERAVVEALLAQEAQHPERPRPILVLTPTDPWLPLDRTLERPKDLPEEEWQRLKEQFEVPTSLRQANRSHYDLAGVALPAGVRFYSRQRFEREYSSERKFDALVARLGGVEPLALSVGRPVISGDTALVTLHLNATWSGCGGVNVYQANRSRGIWHTELKSVLVSW